MLKCSILGCRDVAMSNQPHGYCSTHDEMWREDQKKRGGLPPPLLLRHSIQEEMGEANSIYPFPGMGNTNYSAATINLMSSLCHQRSKDAGWWTDQKTGEMYDVQTTPFCYGAKAALIHSEISESLEGHRKGLMDDKLPHRKMAEVELADALIRIFDLAGACGMDLGGAVVEKLEYNRSRADHKVENRAKEGGKKY